MIFLMGYSTRPAVPDTGKPPAVASVIPLLSSQLVVIELHLHGVLIRLVSHSRIDARVRAFDVEVVSVGVVRQTELLPVVVTSVVGRGLEILFLEPHKRH